MNIFSGTKSDDLNGVIPAQTQLSTSLSLNLGTDSKSVSHFIRLYIFFNYISNISHYTSLSSKEEISNIELNLCLFRWGLNKFVLVMHTTRNVPNYSQ